MRHHQLLITSYWLLLVGIDQGTKYLLFHLQRSLRFTNNLYLEITNSQAPVSLITSLPLTVIIIFITIAGLLLAIRYTKRHAVFTTKKEKKIIQYAVIAITAGGISNLIDHISRGQVADIITIDRLHFNIADTYIVFGSLVIITKLFKKSSPIKPAH